MLVGSKSSFNSSYGKILLVLIGIFGVFVFSNFVSAVACNATIGTEGCTIGGNINLTLDTNTYYFNGTAANGVIQLTGNRANLDCNNSIIIGNYSNNLFAVTTGDYRNNITIKNCIFSNYDRGLYLLGLTNSTLSNITVLNSNTGIRMSFGGSTNNILTNINITNISNIGIWFEAGISFSNITNSYIASSTVSNTAGIYFDGSDDNYITNVTFFNNVIGVQILNVAYRNTIEYSDFNSNGNLRAILLSSYPINTTIRYNSFHNSNNTVGGASNGTLILGNNFTNTNFFPMIGFGFSQKVFDLSIINNSFKNFDVALFIRNVTGFMITNNTFINSTLQVDGYNLGMLIDKTSRNGIISGNNFTNMTNGCILIREANNITINDNNCDLMPIQNKIGIAKDGIEPLCGIQINELYKSYVGDSSESFSDNYTKISTFVSRNITIYNNTFGSNTQCYLRNQGTINIIHDITNYTSFKWQLPYLLDIDELLIRNTQTNLSNVNNSKVYSIDLYQGYNSENTNGRQIKYNWFSTYRYFQNVNTTTRQINVYNLTSPLFYNGTVTSGTILMNTQSNLTLSSQKEIYVKDASWI